MNFRVRSMVIPVFFSMFSIAGCGIYNHGNSDYGQAPLSNTAAAEKAIEQAFLNSGIPAPDDSSKYSLIIRHDKNGMISSAGAEYLFSKGWNLNVKQVGFPAVSISLDTIYVRIISGNSGKEKSALRHSEARISIDVNTSNDSKRVYTGTGYYEDNPPASWVKSNRAKDDFVSYSSGFRKTSSLLVPILYGMTGTVILWLFYSYRN